MTNSDRYYKLYQDGRIAMEKRDYRVALENLQQSAAFLVHFKTHELIGECYLELGKPGDAIVHLAAAAALGNKQVRPYLLLAKALKATGEVYQARGMLQKSLSINPNYRSAKEFLKEIEQEVCK